MTLRHLTIFLTVCDEGGMTAAAEKLHIAQPSVSQAIAELEGYYRVRLFERLGRKLFITAAGQKLLGYVRHILSLYHQADTAMHEFAGQGVLRVGASITVGTYVLPQLLSQFARANPEVQLQSVVNNTMIIEEMLLLDRLDLGLVEGRVHSPAIAGSVFMRDELVLVAAPGHPFTAGELSVGDLEEVGFLVREEGSGTRELFESVMQSRQVNWRIAGVYNNAEAIKQAVARGIAVTVLSELAVREELALGRLVRVRLRDVDFRREFRLVHHKNKYISPLLSRFLDACAAYPKQV
ncbi:MAG: LysR family transcriptional regulator [Sporomusaceae bacterium]|nr:LysR family transcriptional regulator [Sporomusaceae bacterium]